MYQTIDQALEKFYKDNERKMLSTETIRYYIENLTRFRQWLSTNNHTKTKILNLETVDEYKLYLARTMNNKTSINTYLRAVRRFINFLITQKEIKQSFKVSLYKDPYKIKPTFTNKEIELILSSVHPANEPSVIMLLLLSTGIRSRSLCQLHVCDINFSDGYIDLHQTKNGVPLCPPVSNAVLSCIYDYIQIQALLPTDILFKNRYEAAYNKHSLRKLLAKALSNIGVKKSGVQIFRHTFGKVMSMNGCPTAILQKWFGHADIKTTQKYTDLYCNDLRQTIVQVPSATFRYNKF